VGCDLNPTDSLAQARIKALCVRTSKHAHRIKNVYGVGWHFKVPVDACVVKSPTLARCSVVVNFNTNRSWSCSREKVIANISGVSHNPAKLTTSIIETSCLN
jgi:hypothetical protein